MNCYKFCVSRQHYGGVVFAKNKEDARDRIVNSLCDGSIEDCYNESYEADVEVLGRIPGADADMYSVLNPEDGPQED